jgi:hypothetical protein
MSLVDVARKCPFEIAGFPATQFAVRWFRSPFTWNACGFFILEKGIRELSRRADRPDNPVGEQSLPFRARKCCWRRIGLVRFGPAEKRQMVVVFSGLWSL